MKVFFEMFPDAVLKFSDGKEIKVNRAVLCMESKIFEKIFTDLSPDSTAVIQDYDLSTFKLFLNILLGFQDCTAIDALLVFPIAWKYEAKKVIKKCIEVLKPTELNENLCLALNVSLFCDCDELFNDIILSFLVKEKLIFKLLDNEKYYLLLEPESVAALLDEIDEEIDSQILKNVFKWGKIYLGKKNQDINLKSFFDQNRISRFIRISCFETTLSFIEFEKSGLGKDYFTNDEIRDYLLDSGFDGRKCKYFEVKAMETITEKFEIKNVALVAGFNEKLDITRNRVVFYSYPKVESQMLLWTVTYRSDYTGVEVEHKVEESFQEHCFTESNFGTFTLKSRVGNNTVTNLQVTVKFQFFYDARILKTSSKDLVPIESNEENLYFVESLKVTY